jgi:hypothetical protein
MERAREANRSAAAASGISLHLRPSNPGKYLLISLLQAYFDIGGGVALELRLVVICRSRVHVVRAHVLGVLGSCLIFWNVEILSGDCSLM